MTKQPSPADVPGNLRQRAEKLLTAGGVGLRQLPSEEVLELLHELQVHQIELEMQNEELLRAQESITETGNRYADLYDFAPVGYVTLDSQGLIIEVNLTGTRLLGAVRDSLLQKPFILYVAAGDRPAFQAYLRRLPTGGAPQSCELDLNPQQGPSGAVSLESLAILEAGGQVVQYRIAITDITRRRKVEDDLRATEERLRLKLDSILSPDAAIIDEELSNILDTPAIQSLMEDFTILTGMAMAILDLQGKVLVATGWQDICTQFHRVHPEAGQNCTASDLFLAQNLRPGEYLAYKCQNHLWDVATPLFIGGKHVGNIYTGQFFYDDEPIDERLFIDQAAKYGFDREQYLSALRRVPRISRVRVKPLMDFLTKFSALVSKLSYSNLKLAKAMSEQRRIEDTLRQSKEHFRRLTKLSPVPVLIINRRGDIEYVNDRFLTTFGYNLDDIPNLEAWWRRAYPDKNHRLNGMANWQRAVEKATREHTDITIEPSESRVTCKDGTVRIAEIFGTRIGNQNLVILQDITERKRAEEEIVRQSDQLRALGARLAEVEETGREHLARELHDQVCQSLTALGLTLTLLQTQMPKKTAAKLLGVGWPGLWPWWSKLGRPYRT